MDRWRWMFDGSKGFGGEREDRERPYRGFCYRRALEFYT
jgi:hypothetical protein